VALSVFALFVLGVCANATLASSAEPATPAMAYLANISVLLSSEIELGKPATSASVPRVAHGTIGNPGDT